jgi:glycosyltransferase involved in cell wall biosynthesis
MRHPSISIITVCYNASKTIRDTLESVAKQSFTDFEHLIIDGGSTDGTLEIVREWTRHQLRLVSEPDEGIYDAMNKGLALASGEIVGFLNSDDFYAGPAVLQQIANAFEDNSVDACYADLVYITQDNGQVVRCWKSKSFVKGDFAQGWCPAHPTFYVRKSVVARFGLFDTSYRLAADAELMMRYLERGEVNARYVPSVWVRMRLGGKTNQSIVSIFRQNREIIRALERNAVPFSTFWFAGKKIANRARQFILGRIRRHE